MKTLKYYITTCIITGIFATPVYAAPDGVSLFSQLSDAEKSYHEQLFYYVMDTQPVGKGYSWQTYGARGEITRGERVESKETPNCRRFTETITLTGGETATYAGIACKRVGREGWCQLKETDFRSCALEPPENSIKEVLRDASESGSRANTSVRSFIYKWSPF